MALQPITSGFGVTTPGPQIVSNAVYVAMQNVINVLIAAQPNVVTTTALYRQLDPILLIQGVTDLTQVLTLLVSTGTISFCEVLGTYYLPLSGPVPLSQNFTNSGQ
jgi:hypothetical protein